MTGFRLLLAAAALVVAGSLGASALPADAGRVAAINAEHSSSVIPVRSRRSAWCFRRCIAGGRPSCRYADSIEACCSNRCDRRRR
jgi:hypothetical protein